MSLASDCRAQRRRYETTDTAVSAEHVSVARILFAVRFSVLAIVLAATRPTFALPLSGVKFRALAAFACEYGMPCSGCHLGWPLLLSPSTKEGSEQGASKKIYSTPTGPGIKQ